MGRSVSTPADATVICYKDVTHIEEPWEWDDLIEDIEQQCMSNWPSLYTISRWIGNENHCLLENSFCTIGISEYCGLASIWIVPDPSSNLSEGWINKIESKFKSLFGEYNKIATASNGEAFFEKVPS